MGRVDTFDARVGQLEQSAAVYNERLSSHDDKITKMDRDLNGNGTPGIKTTLVHVQEEVIAIKESIDIIKRILFWVGGAIGGSAITASFTYAIMKMGAH